ncbi:hypothetical protein HDU89_003851 [Geranomyces variabilis]|nr:hypothetical protein HDU89_003851 [Geranomyces variabilis]
MRIATLLVALFAGAVSADLSLPTNTIWQNVQAYNQNQDNGENTYHISIVNSYSKYIKDELSAPGQMTFFAPSDHSFARLAQSDPEFLKKWKADPSLINRTLQYHISPQLYDIHSPATKVSVTTMLNTRLPPARINAYISPSTPKNPPGWVVCTLNGDQAIKATIVHTMKSSNGILYVIDTMLRPPPRSSLCRNKVCI